MTALTIPNIEEIRTFLREILRSGQLDESAFYEIEESLFDEGIDVGKLKKYVKPFLNNNQIKEIIREIKFWLVNGLDLDRFIQEFGTDVTGSFMEFVAEGLLKGYSWEQVKKLARIYMENYNGDYYIDRDIYLGFELGLSEEEIRFYTRPEFDRYQREEIMLGFENGLTMEEVKTYAKPEIYSGEMEKIRESLQEKTMRERQEYCRNGDKKVLSFLLKLRKSGKFDNDQLRQIRLGFLNGLTLEQVKVYAKPELNEYQMREIRLGFQNGLSMRKVKFYANPSFDSAEMEEIRLGFQNKLSEEQIKFYADPSIPWTKMREIRLGFQNKLSIEQIKFYMNFDDGQRIREIRLGFENGLSWDEVKFYAKKEFDPFLMKQIRLCFENKIPLKQVEFYINNFYKTGLVNQYQLAEILIGLLDGLTQEQIEFYARPDFGEFLMREIRLGFKAGLTMDQVKLYAKPEFNEFVGGESRARTIRYGFLHGLTKEQISLYARPEFNLTAMRLIKNAFLRGYTTEEVKYALKRASKQGGSSDLELDTNLLHHLLTNRENIRKILLLEEFKSEFKKERTQVNNKKKSILL